MRRLAAPTAGSLVLPGSRAAGGRGPDSSGPGAGSLRHQSRLEAELAEVDADLASLDNEIALQKLEVSRFSRGAEWGAVSLVQRESSREDLVRLEGEQVQPWRGVRGYWWIWRRVNPLSLDGLVLEIHREGNGPAVMG